MGMFKNFDYTSSLNNDKKEITKKIKYAYIDFNPYNNSYTKS